MKRGISILLAFYRTANATPPLLGGLKGPVYLRSSDGGGNPKHDKQRSQARDRRNPR